MHEKRTYFLKNIIKIKECRNSVFVVADCMHSHTSGPLNMVKNGKMLRIHTKTTDQLIPSQIK